ncbi:MAG TPA: 50S ribosomal protein L11 methyltransferase [Longimicrobiales bacterium]|nr:50S ribosomal protein L11 methyltransferase [Longimicrobiales bacterium]
MVHHAGLRAAAATLTAPRTTAPPRAEMERLLTDYAPLTPVPLCPRILAHQAPTLIDIWEAAERLAGQPLAAPFWAYAWPGGCALARVLLDRPELVRGQRVLDFGAGGGVTALAASYAGAAAVTANDIDPWALLVADLAANARGLALSTLAEDLCDAPALVDDYDVVLCSDLAYERRETPRQRAVLDRAVANQALVLVADAGRTYFDPSGMALLAEYDIEVPRDLEGVPRREARVYRL